MAIKVYGLPMSTNVARVLVCLEEVGAQYEVVPIDFSTGQHKSPEHTARNVSHIQLPLLFFSFNLDGHNFFCLTAQVFALRTFRKEQRKHWSKLCQVIKYISEEILFLLSLLLNVDLPASHS